jgi:hypothetical protein
VNEGLTKVNAKDNTNSVLRLILVVTGFTDAEGSFRILMRRDPRLINSSVPYS